MTVNSIATRSIPASPVTASDHVQVDDAAVQLGILDRAERLDDVGFGDGHSHS